MKPSLRLVGAAMGLVTLLATPTLAQDYEGHGGFHG